MYQYILREYVSQDPNERWLITDQYDDNMIKRYGASLHRLHFRVERKGARLARSRAVRAGM